MTRFCGVPLVLLIAQLASAAFPYNTLTGNWTANVVILNWPTDAVSQILNGYDKTASLAEIPDKIVSNIPQGTRPVILTFGNQSNLNTEPALVHIDQYYELIMIIPFVNRQGSKLVHSTMPLLYLNNLEAILGGNLYYSFPKKYADIKWTPDQSASNSYYSIAGELQPNSPFIEASFTTNSKPLEYGSVSKLLNVALPVLNTDVGFQRNMLGYICYDYDTHLTDQSTMYTPIQASVKIHSSFLPGVPVGSWDVDPLNANNLLGAFQVKTWWTLSSPFNWCKADQ
jgi:hypothetical protein